MAVLVDRSVGRTLFSMAFPMLAGTFAMNAYNLTDTWFVSRLGTPALAAMGFAFPVLMLLISVGGGIGMGITTLFSHAIGRGDQGGAKRLVTHGMLLIIAMTAALSIAGYFSIGTVFRRLGAEGQALELVGQYMRIWYFGAVFRSVQWMGSGVLISTGDSKAASRLMILGTVLNVILDPIMIFGWAGWPAMGIRGAALATVISQGVATGWLLQLLGRKHGLLVWETWGLRDYAGSVRRIMRFAIPGVLSMILMPISATVITRLLSGFGYEAVAATGAAARIEMFAFVIPMALGISLMPFVSQNFGAGRVDRVRQAHKVSVRFALWYGGVVAVVFFVSAPWLARVFSDDAKVVETLVWYIRIIPFGYGMMEVHRYCGFILTGLHKPASATMLNGLRVLVFLIPLSYFGAHFLGVRGVFCGRLVTDLVVGSIGLVWVARAYRSVAGNVKEGQDEGVCVTGRPGNSEDISAE